MLRHCDGTECARLVKESNGARGVAASRKLDESVLAAVGLEAQSLIERQRARMVERAGVDQKPRDRFGPGVHRRVIEKEIAELPADVLRNEPEVGNVGGGGVTKIELRQAGRASVGIEHV